MKKIITTITVALSLLLFYSGQVWAQTSPTISPEYTVTQIDEMYKKHKMYDPQDTYPPQSLQNRLLQDFPKARDVEWEKSDVLYEVEFEIGRFPSKDYKAYYDMKGNLIMYREEIPVKAIPAVIKNGALAKYPNFKFEDAKIIKKGKETFYRVELEKGDYEVKITLDANGIITNEQMD